MISARRSVSVPSLFVLGAVLAGCAASAPDSSDGSSSALETTAATSTTSIHGKITKYGSGGVAFPGVTICLQGHSEPCVTTGDDGTFTLEATIADGEELLIAASKPDFQTTVFPRRFDPAATSVEIGGYQLISASLFHQLVQMLSGQAYDATKGAVVLNAAGTWPTPPTYLAGATVAYTPAAHVVYANESGMPDPSVTATTVGGHALTAIAGVTPGTVSAQMTLPGKKCDAYQGWSSDDGSIRVPVIADTLVSAIALCQ